MTNFMRISFESSCMPLNPQLPIDAESRGNNLVECPTYSETLAGFYLYTN